jgi:hypothetical protein
MAPTIVYQHIVTAAFPDALHSRRKMADFIEWVEDSFEVEPVTTGQTVVVTVTEYVYTSEIVDELMESYLDQILSFEVKRQVHHA